VLHDRIVLAGSVLGEVTSFSGLIGITPGTLYQKRYCGDIDWPTGNLIQYTGAAVLFTLGAVAFGTREIHWSGELILAMAWRVLVLSIAAVGLMYWLIRRSAATGFASLIYLVPVVTALFAHILFGAAGAGAQAMDATASRPDDFSKPSDQACFSLRPRVASCRLLGAVRRSSIAQAHLCTSR